MSLGLISSVIFLSWIHKICFVISWIIVPLYFWKIALIDSICQVSSHLLVFIFLSFSLIISFLCISKSSLPFPLRRILGIYLMHTSHGSSLGYLGCPALRQASEAAAMVILVYGAVPYYQKQSYQSYSLLLACHLRWKSLDLSGFMRLLAPFDYICCFKCQKSNKYSKLIYISI